MFSIPLRDKELWLSNLKIQDVHVSIWKTTAITDWEREIQKIVNV